VRLRRLIDPRWTSADLEGPIGMSLRVGNPSGNGPPSGIGQGAVCRQVRRSIDSYSVKMSKKLEVASPAPVTFTVWLPAGIVYPLGAPVCETS